MPIVCHCNGISERAIERYVREGARTPVAVARACGAGACCGGCTPRIREIIAGVESEADLRKASSLPPTPLVTSAAG